MSEIRGCEIRGWTTVQTCEDDDKCNEQVFKPSVLGLPRLGDKRLLLISVFGQTTSRSKLLTCTIVEAMAYNPIVRNPDGL